jgi:periplasmic divalent cation tolerance protein
MSEDTQACVVLTTVGSRADADALAEAVVEGRLAACVQMVPIDSVYRWDGEVVRDTEVLLLVKTTADRYPELEAAIEEIHPYQTPEVVALPVLDGLPAYLTWIRDSTR